MSSELRSAAETKPRLHPAVFLVGAVLAVSLFGDSLLYGVFPVHAEDLGIPLAFVGVVLSINRWIRLVSNPLAVRVFRKIGVHRALVLAAVGTVVTVIIYAYPLSLLLLLGARMLWGICWSHLRLGSYLVVIHTARDRLGLAMGSMQAVSRLGSAFTLLLGGALVDNLGYTQGLTIMAALSALALPLVLFLRVVLARDGHVLSVEDQPPAKKADSTAGLASGQEADKPRAPLPIPFCFAGAFTNSLVTQGLVMASIALLLQQRLPADVQIAGVAIGAGTIAGLVLASRWVSTFLIAPVMGHLSDQIGRRPLILTGFAFQGAALLFIGLTASPVLTVLGAVLMFFTSSAVETMIHAAAADPAQPGGAAARMSTYATFSDMGSATGPLVGYALASVIGFPLTYVLGAAVVWTLFTVFSLGRSAR